MAEPAKVERASTWSDVVEEGKRIFLSMVIWCPLELNNTLSLAYRFQLAGYKNEREYLAVTKLDTVSSKHCLDVLPSHLLTLSLLSPPHTLTTLISSHSHYSHLLTLSLPSPPQPPSCHKVDRWPHNNYVKKLRRRDGCFYYYDRKRECPEKDLQKVKLYIY